MSDDRTWNVTLYFRDGDNEPVAVTTSNASYQGVDSLTDAMVGTGNVLMFFDDNKRLWAIPSDRVDYLTADPVSADG